MKDVSWISARWMMIQNQTIMCLFGDNTTFTFRRSDCDWKKASDKKFNRGLGKPRYLVVWKTRYTKKEQQASCYLTRNLGYLKSRGLVVCRSLPCCHLFFMSCMTLESDKMFHKFKTNLRRKIRTVLKRKGWSTLGRVFFWQSMTPKRCNIYSDGDDHPDGCEPWLS